MADVPMDTGNPEDDADPKDKLASADDPDELLDEAKEFLKHCVDADTNREDALEDLKFLSGDQWPDKAQRDRELDGRPCLTINKLPTFVHQVTNDQRQNVPSIKVSPVSEGADVDTAQVYQGLVRHIEYASNADVAYDTAVNSAAQIGFGFFRLVTDYASPSSHDQVVKFKRIRNPFTVYIDPFSEEPDGSDMKRAMISLKVPREQFKRDYPNAEASTDGFSTGVGDSALQHWLGEDFVRVAEYYRIEHVPDEAIELSNGETGYKSQLVELPQGVTITRTRKTQRPKTMLYKITALDVLEQTEILCPWIPVFPVYGDELDIDGNVIRTGLVRHARDPAQMYNYWMTAATEEVAMRTKTPFIGAAGQFEGFEDDWGSANVRSYPYLEYNPIELNGNALPAPVRQPMTDIPGGVLAMAMHANDNIKATTGLFDSSLGARGNATSGIQEREQQRQGDVANFHYTDNLNRTVRHVGRCLVAMIPKYYDAERVVRIMGDDEKISSVKVNQAVQETDEEGQAIQRVLNDLTAGEYDVTVKAGPSYSTLREEAVSAMIDLGGKWPKLMDVAGDKVIRAMDWPGAEEIADRVAKTIPPELRDDGEQQQQAPTVQTPQGPIPVEQAGQMLAQMHQQMQAQMQQLQELGQQLQEAQSGIEKARIDANAKVHVAEINAVSKNDVAELQATVQLLLERIPPPAAVEAPLPPPTPEPEAGPSQLEILLSHLVAHTTQPPAPTPKKRMRITAPSGAVYDGEIGEDAPQELPPGSSP